MQRIRNIGTLGFFLWLSGLLSGQQIDIDERIQVSREVFDVRVLDGRDRPIQGLVAEDFTLKIDNRQIPILSCEWVDSVDQITVPQTGAEPGDPVGAGTADSFWSNQQSEQSADSGSGPPVGRLIVLFFQGDIGSERQNALLRMGVFVPALFEGLTPFDYVAVYSFHSHLTLHCDFTQDRALIKEAIFSAVRKSDDVSFMASGYPSLAPYFDEERAKDVARPEKALEEIARNLTAFPGVKNMVYVGYGFGRFNRGHVQIERQYDDAVAALNEARVTVFSLDITRAQFHSLEKGMRFVASDTGGTYQTTDNFPENAVRNVTQAFRGYYRLSYEMPQTMKERPRYKLTLKSKGILYVRHPYNGSRPRQ